MSAGYEEAEPGSLEGDLEFLYTAVKKVEAIREDLGSVGPVIAQQVEEAMVGARRTLQTEEAEKHAVERKVLKIERDLREDIRLLRERLDETIRELNIGPESVERVVRTALELAHQPPLVERTLERKGSSPVRVFELPALTGSWARCTEGLAHPVSGEIRPITFDHAVAAGHDDVVLVHLQHRLVQQSMRLLRAEIWATDAAARLARVTARVARGNPVSTPLVTAHGRLVVTGADGHRLHEEIITAGGALKDGRFGRLGVGEIEAALGADHPGLVRAIREASREASRALGRYIGPRPTEQALPSPLPPTGKTEGLRSLLGTGGDPVRAVSRWCRRQAEAFA